MCLGCQESQLPSTPHLPFSLRSVALITKAMDHFDSSPFQSLGERPNEKIRLQGVEETLFCTLLPKAIDAESENPILGCPYAKKLMDSCEVDSSSSVIGNTVQDHRAIKWTMNRTKTFDRWCQDFLDRHEKVNQLVTVVHMGCGLDCRMHRVKRGPNVRWYDLDRPQVVNLRSKLIPQMPHGDYQLRTLDVSTSAWMKDIPADRPTLIMAEGMFMYLPPSSVESTISNAVDYFQTGEIILDTVCTLYCRFTDHIAPIKSSGAKWLWGTDDAKASVEKFHPSLTMIDREWSVDYMGRKPFGQSMAPFFGQDWTGTLKMALASFSSSNDAHGQNARFEFNKKEVRDNTEAERSLDTEL